MDCEGSFIEVYTGQLYSTAGVVLLLQHSDNLSKTLQSPHITAAEGQRSMTIHLANVALMKLMICFEKKLSILVNL